ncbi:hypothetical protein R3P38DRAFT_3392747 [Favolaschia claudopus]|uniref:F-box domain-containing protein n=1 Tax=Favolaschia claudopus TaxID=2862362 RepID=A0AAW0C0A2_9AGAR
MGDSEAQNPPIPPISTLPPEILLDIFALCLVVGWLNIPKVNRLWRNIALECSELWSAPILTRLKWTPIFLARSKMAALVIRADVKRLGRRSLVAREGLQDVVLQNASRLGILQLRSPQDDLAEFLDDLESADAAPRLRCLEIVNTTANHVGTAGLWLPQDLFRKTETMEGSSGTRSHLRLHLEGCTFPWGSAWNSNLTHLHLEYIGLDQRPTMEQLLAVLVASPALKTLTLIHCSPNTFDGFPVALPQLAALSTIRSSYAATCAHILKFLIVPPFATTYDTVWIIHRDGFAYSLNDSARPWWFRRFKIEGRSCQPYHSLCNATLRLIDTLDVNCVTRLHLNGMQGTALIWVRLGQRLKNVRALHLHKTIPAEWLDFLLTQTMFVLGLTHWNYQAYGLYHRDEDGRPERAWVGLQHLGLHNLDLGEVSPPNLPPIPVSRSELLRALLWARRDVRRKRAFIGREWRDVFLFY